LPPQTLRNLTRGFRCIRLFHDRYLSVVFGGNVCKRGIDVLISSIVLLASLPILILSALVIRFTSPGPILFRQLRMGRGSRPFQILKLRTMAFGEAGPAYTLGDDPRITRFGKWLRRTKLDEFPQLWNVLCGEMSLVGPRPVLPELTEEFESSYRRLLMVRPGLTDPASLKYSQEAKLLGTVPDAMHFFKTVVTPDKLRISIEYLDYANLWTDWTVLAMTAAICCFPSLSRVYGQLPNAEAHVAGLRPRLVPAARRAPMALHPPRIGPHSVGLPDLEEEFPELPALPWISAQLPGFSSKSTSSGTPGRASRL
jgi:lipopolysaccharide/colanic/teichoic acid biosynthesis glycosyltransferase